MTFDLHLYAVFTRIIPVAVTVTVLMCFQSVHIFNYCVNSWHECFGFVHENKCKKQHSRLYNELGNKESEWESVLYIYTYEEFALVKWCMQRHRKKNTKLFVYNICKHLSTASLQETLQYLATLTLDYSAAGWCPQQLRDLLFPDVGCFLHKLRVQECSNSFHGNTSRFGQRREVQSISPRTSNARGPTAGSRGSAHKAASRWFWGACWRGGIHSHTEGPCRKTCQSLRNRHWLRKVAIAQGAQQRPCVTVILGFAFHYSWVGSKSWPLTNNLHLVKRRVVVSPSLFYP